MSPSCDPREATTSPRRAISFSRRFQKDCRGRVRISGPRAFYERYYAVRPMFFVVLCCLLFFFFSGKIILGADGGGGGALQAAYVVVCSFGDLSLLDRNIHGDILCDRQVHGTLLRLFDGRRVRGDRDLFVKTEDIVTSFSCFLLIHAPTTLHARGKGVETSDGVK